MGCQTSIYTLKMSLSHQVSKSPPYASNVSKKQTLFLLAQAVPLKVRISTGFCSILGGIEAQFRLEISLNGADGGHLCRNPQ